MHKLKTIFLTLLTVFNISALTFAPVIVHAQSSIEAACEGVQVDGSTGDCTDTSSGTALSNLIRVAIRIFQVIIGIIALFMIIMAGLSYITSGGDSNKTKTAKDRILYSAIGLAVVALAEVIIQFVLNRVSNPGN